MELTSKATAKVMVLALAGGLLTIATKYCLVNALTKRDTSEAPTWRTLKTWRVDAPPAFSEPHS